LEEPKDSPPQKKKKPRHLAETRSSGNLTWAEERALVAQGRTRWGGGTGNGAVGGAGVLLELLSLEGRKGKKDASGRGKKRHREPAKVREKNVLRTHRLFLLQTKTTSGARGGGKYSSWVIPNEESIKACRPKEEGCLMFEGDLRGGSKQVKGGRLEPGKPPKETTGGARCGAAQTEFNGQRIGGLVLETTPTKKKKKKKSVYLGKGNSSTSG